MKKKIIGMVCVIGAVLAAAYFLKNNVKPLEVETAEVKKGDIAEYVEELGLVVSENKAGIFAPTAGRVTEVRGNVGDVVNKGDLLIKIDSQQLSKQIAELEAQKAAIRAQYNEAVKPIDSKEIEKLQLQISNQEKRVKEAERQRDIHKLLYEEEAISKEEYNQRELTLQEEASRLEAVKLDLELLRKPASQNIGAGYKAQLKQLDIQIEKLRDQGEDFAVTSPLQGTVMEKSAEVGSYLLPGAEIMRIEDTEELYLESDVLVSEIAKIKVGSKVEISHEDLGVTGVKGTVRKIHPQAFSKVSDLGIEQKRIKIEIAMEEKLKGLRPGYDLDLKVIVNSQKGALLIPESAVFEMNSKKYVFVNQDNIAVLREIKTGLESKNQMEVIEGLEEGEQVVLSPDGKLEEGMAIT